MSVNINNQVKIAAKWSAITELAAKLVSPISTIVLARLLSPEAFGVLVTATMVISFAEIFTDAGFQKYIVQHDFKSRESLNKSTAVAFWSNLIFSLIIWVGICIFSTHIARLVGNDGYGLVIAISCICIPLEGFSSIQMALFKRELDFKTLFHVRIIGIFVPLVITIPLAILTKSYWSLIIGMIALNVCNAVLLTIKSKWKPQWFYSIKHFKEMFSFTMWSMVESITLWLSGYLDVFIVGTLLSTYYMGIYRTTINTVGGIMAIITSVTTPILFAALSRLQNSPDEFKQLFFKFQKLVGMLVIPLGVGIYLFRDLVTAILLGDQWIEACNFIGWWGLFSAINIVMAHYSSEVFRSLGKPKLSVIAQTLHMLILIPVVLFTVRYGFETLAFARSAVRLTLAIINLVLLYYLIRITTWEMLRNVSPSFIASFSMIVIVWILPNTESMIVKFIYAFICALGYLVVICMFKNERYIILNFKYIIKKT